ncbi:hypothetical protein [Anatilimnocola floriformis]|uniref:hypothetical protein n=1 Tax=Anatilimnocola floriformis TaxID=2948575 RepID=UPI0020C230F4|nr:hypothetical protein [Anatilimnocola floriformis]
MTRLIILLLAVLVTTASFNALEVVAGSSKNPYSSYNISGINYGSQQWEREHGKTPSMNSTRGRFRRR